jgi:hypothetical protein
MCTRNYGAEEPGEGCLLLLLLLRLLLLLLEGPFTLMVRPNVVHPCSKQRCETET